MALSIKKINESKSKLIKIYDGLLEDYLEKYEIAKELFDVTQVRSNCDNVILRKYYDSTLEKANILVLEDEFVGITYDNLEIINDVLENKLVKRM